MQKLSHNLPQFYTQLIQNVHRIAPLVAGCDDAAARLVHLAALLVVEDVDLKVLQGVRRFTPLI